MELIQSIYCKILLTREVQSVRGLVSPEQDRLCFIKEHEDRETESHRHGECRVPFFSVIWF